MKYILFKSVLIFLFNKIKVGNICWQENVDWTDGSGAKSLKRWTQLCPVSQYSAPTIYCDNAQKLRIFPNGHLGIWWCCLSLENGQIPTLSWSIAEGAEVKDISISSEKYSSNLLLFELGTIFDLFLGTDDKYGISNYGHYRKRIFMSSVIESALKIHFEYAPKHYFWNAGRILIAINWSVTTNSRGWLFYYIFVFLKGDWLVYIKSTPTNQKLIKVHSANLKMINKEYLRLMNNDPSIFIYILSDLFFIL